MSTISHDGYIAQLEIDAETGVISGLVVNTNATLHFQGYSVAEAKAAFIETIEDYRAWCASEGREPERPFSGKLSLRLPADLHGRVAAAAARAGKSINGFITETLAKAAA